MIQNIGNYGPNIEHAISLAVRLGMVLKKGGWRKGGVPCGALDYQPRHQDQRNYNQRNRNLEEGTDPLIGIKMELIVRVVLRMLYCHFYAPRIHPASMRYLLYMTPALVPPSLKTSYHRRID